MYIRNIRSRLIGVPVSFTPGIEQLDLSQQRRPRRYRFNLTQATVASHHPFLGRAFQAGKAALHRRHLVNLCRTSSPRTSMAKATRLGNISGGPGTFENNRYFLVVTLTKTRALSRQIRPEPNQVCNKNI